MLLSSSTHQPLPAAQQQQDFRKVHTRNSTFSLRDMQKKGPKNTEEGI